MAKTMPISRGILPLCCRRPGVATAAAAAARACGVCAGCSTLLLWLLHICKSTRPHLRVNWSDPFEDINAETWRRALFSFNPRFFGSLWGGCCMGILSVGTQLKCLHLRLLTRSWLRFALWNFIQLLFANLGFCGGLGLVAGAFSLLTSLLALFVHLAYPRLPVSLNVDIMPSPPQTRPLSPTPLSAAGCVTSRSPRKAKVKGKEKQPKRRRNRALNPTTSVAANAEQHRKEDSSACEMQHPEQQTLQRQSTGDLNQQQEVQVVQQQQEDNQQQQEVNQHQGEETEAPLQQKHAEGALRQQEENKEFFQEGLEGSQHEEETPNDATVSEGIADDVAVGAEERLHAATATSVQPENSNSSSFSSSGDDIAADGLALVAIAVHADAAETHAAAAVTHATPADSGHSSAAHDPHAAAADPHAAAAADASYAVPVHESHANDDSLPPAAPDSHVDAAVLDNCEDIAAVGGTDIEDAGAP